MIIFIVTPSRFISENPFFHLSVANISIFSGYAILCRGNNDIVGKDNASENYCRENFENIFVFLI